MKKAKAIEELEGLKRYLLIHGWQDFTSLDMAIDALKELRDCSNCRFKVIMRDEYPCTHCEGWYAPSKWQSEDDND